MKSAITPSAWGTTSGEHTIVFGLIGETIDLHVRGQSRDSYAYGALAAAKFLVTKKAGLLHDGRRAGPGLISHLAKSTNPSSSLASTADSRNGP